MPDRILLAPSLLSADFGDLARGTRLVEEIGGDLVHLDVMDGHFVPNITFGPKVISDLRKISHLPFDVHLMVEKPENFVGLFCGAGANYLTVHWEATTHAHRVLSAIRECGVRPGISIVPATPAEALSEVLGMVDMVLVMTVEPGFGGQELISQCLKKVETLRRLKEANGYTYLVEVDGGINRNTVALARDAGAEVIVAGSAIFEAADPAEEARILRGMARG